MTMTQRSNQWRQARLGAVTASRFADVLTAPSAKGVSVEGQKSAWHVVCENKTVSGDFDRKVDAQEARKDVAAEWAKTHWSQTTESYANELLSELVHGQPADVWRSDATDWGTANEPNAFQAAGLVIEKRLGQRLSLPEGEHAYIEHPTEKYIGCSPDGMIGDEALCELKAPYNGAKWIAAKRKGLVLPAENRAQVQGQLWVADRQWCAFCYFDPRVAASGLDPLLWVRVERDDEYIDNVLAPRVIAFRDYLRTEYQKLISEGEPF